MRSIPLLFVAALIACQIQAPANAQFNRDLYVPGGAVLPPSHSGVMRWRLGVVAAPTPTGMLISRVEPGSAAAAAGIQPLDTIVAVNDQRVGYVMKQLYDMSEVIEAQANRRGRVTLLILDGRRKILRNVQVRAGSAASFIQGAIACPTGRIPPGAQLVVQLMEYSRPGGPPIMLHRQVVPSVIAGRSLSYQLPYDPSMIVPGRQYAVTAQLVGGNQVYWSNRQPQYVLTNGRGSLANLQLAATLANSQPAWTTQMRTIEQWYGQYLGRQIRASERSAWQAHLRRGDPLSDVQAYLLGSREYYDRSQSRGGYVSRIYQDMYRRQPTAAELARYNQMLRGGSQRIELMKRMIRDSRR